MKQDDIKISMYVILLLLFNKSILILLCPFFHCPLVKENKNWCLLEPYDQEAKWPNYLESDAKCLPSLKMFVAEHPWLQNAKKASNVPLGDIVRTRLKQFSVMNRFKKRALRVSICFSLCIIVKSSLVCIGSIRKFEWW